MGNRRKLLKALSLTGADGVRYQTVNVTAAGYNANTAGALYDPSIAGGVLSIRIIAFDAGANTVVSRLLRFGCPAPFDPVANGVLP